MALGCVVEAVEDGDVGGLEMLGGMDSALEVREERAFKMDADGAGKRGVVGGVVEEFSEAGERAERVVDGGGDGGG